MIRKKIFHIYIMEIIITKIIKNCSVCLKEFNKNDSKHKKFCSYDCFKISVNNSKKQYFLKNKDELYKKFNLKRNKKFICSLCKLLTTNKTQHNKSKF